MNSGEPRLATLAEWKRARAASPRSPRILGDAARRNPRARLHSRRPWDRRRRRNRSVTGSHLRFSLHCSRTEPPGTPRSARGRPSGCPCLPPFSGATPQRPRDARRSNEAHSCSRVAAWRGNFDRSALLILKYAVSEALAAAPRSRSSSCGRRSARACNSLRVPNNDWNQLRPRLIVLI